ncbi:MAG TPA: chitinase [Polyangiaceae bacterium]|nr:chitinase [Polyangiaceae bacterium]
MSSDLEGRPWRATWLGAIALLCACSDGGDGADGAGGASAAGSAGAGGSRATGGGAAGSGGSSGANAGAPSGGGAGASGSSGGTSSGSGGSSAAGAAGSAGASSSGNGATLGDVLGRELFASMFPNANALYSYDALVEAAEAYPEFATVGTPEERRRELAAFLGNISHETTGGWPTAPGGPEAWGLYFTQEVGCEEGACTQYCDASNTQYPCQPGKTYHGRGPIQLSWNYNYGALGEVLGLGLLQDPDLVTRDGVIAFTTALWFWMTTQPPKPSAHDALLGLWTPSDADIAAGRQPGFGMTVNIINGGLECNRPTDDRVRDRIRYFEHFVSLLGTTAGDRLECADMQSY